MGLPLRRSSECIRSIIFPPLTNYLRLELATHISECGRYPTRAARIAIAGRRDRLRTKIERFHAQALRLLGDQVLAIGNLDTEELPVYRDPDTELTSNDMGEPDVEEFRPPPGTLPEKMKLALPSTFQSNRTGNIGLHTLSVQELKLRRGQAHDELQAIRLLISQKSVQYTKGLRAADRRALKTRAQSALQKLTHDLTHHRRVYQKARLAMKALGIDPNDLLTTYRELEHSDLKTSTLATDPNAPGLSRVQLSWIWTVGEPDASSPDIVTACEYSVRPRDSWVLII